MSQQTISRYLIYSELDRGGMAIVYHAHDPNFDRDVAIKVLPHQFLHDRTFRARFQREAQAVAMLEHPAIVPVYDFGEEQGQMYLVMRYMTGGSLAARLQHGPMSLADVAHIIHRLAPGLDRAHSLGVIHRDLKPANILFDGEGEAYITDFGIARLVETTVDLTASNVVVGTPAYMSPEQARDSSEIDGRADIYSLGVIVFQMLTARLPYEANSSIGYLTAHVTDPVPNILEANPNLSPSCRPIIERVMAKDPADRYQRADELASDLHEATQSSSIAETLKASLYNDTMATVSRGATRRTPLPVPSVEQIRPPVLSRPGKIPRSKHQWKVIGAWLGGSAAATILACLILASLGVLDGLPAALGRASQTPDFPVLGGHTKVATRLPLPTDTPTLTPTQSPSPTNTLTATSLPIVRPSPTDTATMTATATLTTTFTPAPTYTPLTPPGLDHGLIDIQFVLHKTYIATNEAIKFDFSLTNSNSYAVEYGLLGVEVYYADAALFFIHTSFEDGALSPGQVLTYTDSFSISSPGSYGAKLIICYDKLQVCNTSSGRWERLSPLIWFDIYVGNTPTALSP
ncbi:MAG: protein kinase [Anaerolineae bacterium]|nr:protein kinase [Anaerolineae bacterium]